jgi:dimethylglycine dehydrogenase
VSGVNAAARLDLLLASKLPNVGRVRLAPMLSDSGRLMGDLTVMRIEEDRFMIFGSGYLQAWHGRWFDEHLAGEGVTIRNVTLDHQGIHLVGPNARKLLERLTTLDVSSKALPFMAVRRADIGSAPGIIARVSLSGELTYELYAPAQFIRSIYLKALELGADLGAVNFGVNALISMRLEKSYGIWSREFSRDYTPAMSGLDRFIDFTKPDFIGREAAFKEQESSTKQKLVTFAIDALDADATGYEPVFLDGEYVGFITSGGYGHRVGSSIAMAYVDRVAIEKGGNFTVPILGAMRPAHISTEPLYDPSGALARA